jgi:hypothetical protein
MTVGTSELLLLLVGLVVLGAAASWLVVGLGVARHHRRTTSYPTTPAAGYLAGHPRGRLRH